MDKKYNNESLVDKILEKIKEWKPKTEIQDEGDLQCEFNIFAKKLAKDIKINYDKNGFLSVNVFLKKGENTMAVFEKKKMKRSKKCILNLNPYINQMTRMNGMPFLEMEFFSL
jgi:hypothetical protein